VLHRLKDFAQIHNKISQNKIHNLTAADWGMGESGGHWRQRV